MEYKRPVVGPFSCAQCGKKFFIEKRNLARRKRENKDIKNLCCSRSCAAKSRGSWKSPFKRIISRSRKAAKCKGMEFNLTLEYIIDLWFKQKGACALSGIAMAVPDEDKPSTPQTGSLDRINSNEGYLEGNVQWICLSLNYGKYSWSEEEFKKFLTHLSLNIARNEVVQHKR